MTQRPLDSDQNISSVNAQVQELQKRTVLAGPADKAVFVFLFPPPPADKAVFVFFVPPPPLTLQKFQFCNILQHLINKPSEVIVALQAVPHCLHALFA